MELFESFVLADHLNQRAGRDDASRRVARLSDPPRGPRRPQNASATPCPFFFCGSWRRPPAKHLMRACAGMIRDVTDRHAACVVDEGLGRLFRCVSTSLDSFGEGIHGTGLVTGPALIDNNAGIGTRRDRTRQT